MPAIIGGMRSVVGFGVSVGDLGRGRRGRKEENAVGRRKGESTLDELVGAVDADC